MLIEQTLLGERDKIKIAIELLKSYEHVAIKMDTEGYYVNYSGGKDSETIAYLCILAGVKFALHHNHTTLDTPELVRHVRKMQVWYKENFNIDLFIHYPEESMWDLMPRKLFPPTRRSRYCCDVLKERGGTGRFCVTGVRWSESNRRANNRALMELNAYSSKKNLIKLNNDNSENRRLVEGCQVKSKHMVNPIIHWSDEDVWEFIRKYNLPYCELYDQGWERLGCIGCPLSSKNQERELVAYPAYKENYLRAFRRMTQKRKEKGKTFWINEEDAEEMMEWWIHGTTKSKQLEGQIAMEQIIDLEDEELGW